MKVPTVEKWAAGYSGILMSFFFFFFTLNTLIDMLDVCMLLIEDTRIYTHTRSHRAVRVQLHGRSNAVPE